MTPNQVFTVAAIGGTAGFLGLALLAALSYGAGVLANRAFEHLCEKRRQWKDRRAGRAARREFDRLTALYDLPAHDPREHR
jgi:hypothetical protein